MQCPLVSCAFVAPQFIFVGIGLLGVVLGILSVVSPKRSVGLYQWIMERINWKVAPIDETREMRNTRLLGGLLVLLSSTIFFLIFFRR